MKGGFVYILASKSGVLYTGVTNSLDKRILQHRFKVVEGFEHFAEHRLAAVDAVRGARTE